jgi:hypothetical protein
LLGAADVVVFRLLIAMLIGSAVFAYVVQRGRRNMGKPLSDAQILVMNLLLVSLAAAAVVIVVLTWRD